MALVMGAEAKPTGNLDSHREGNVSTAQNMALSSRWMGKYLFNCKSPYTWKLENLSP